MSLEDDGFAKDALQRAGSAAGRGSKDFEDFIYILSHDVRSSVRALLELPQWIKEDLISEGHAITGSLAENIDLMNVHTRRLDRMLIDLLSHSRVGRMQTVRSNDLETVLEHVLDELVRPKGLEITTEFQCKSLRMGEVDIMTFFSTLISNAIKHHDRATGHIHISSQEQGSECVVRVEDDGPGIPLKNRDRVFEAMTTLKPRDEVEGSGMGLAIVRKIVDLYGGKVCFGNSTEERGTVLEFRFQI